MEPVRLEYRVLLVSATQKLNDAITPLLRGCGCAAPECVGDISSARRTLLQHSFDIVVINTPLPDEFGTRFALDISQESGTGVLLLVRAENYADIDAKVAPFGVLAIQKPTNSAVLSQSIRLLCATRQRLRRMEQKTASIEEKMQEIRLVNQAKWLLVEQLKMSEPDAHRFIQKSAMDRGISRKSVAESVIRMYS